MTKDEVLAISRDCRALLERHSMLSWGLRSPVFLPKAKLFQYAAPTEKLCRGLAAIIRAGGSGDVLGLVSPASAGITPGYEAAPHFGTPAFAAERLAGRLESPSRTRSGVGSKGRVRGVVPAAATPARPNAEPAFQRATCRGRGSIGRRWGAFAP
ncbi:MAG: orotate phosphoribosyltransferase [Devosia sp.]|nr:orotate phosphoribosyltransferase [Devosia sp.]